jgi:hypothetical protein
MYELQNTTILLGTCDTFHRIAEVSVGLLDKLWPLHPPIIAACCKKAVMAQTPIIGQPWPSDRKGHWPVRSIINGEQRERDWTDRMLATAKAIMSKYVLLWLDDYFLAEPPNDELIKAAYDAHESDAGIGRIDFNQNLPDGSETYKPDKRFVVHPKTKEWLWSMNTQAALWKRDSLIAVLSMFPHNDIWRFELIAGDAYRAGKLDHHQLATKERAMHYANLVAQGKLRDQFGLEVARQNGFEITKDDIPGGF